MQVDLELSLGCRERGIIVLTVIGEALCVVVHQLLYRVVHIWSEVCMHRESGVMCTNAEGRTAR